MLNHKTFTVLALAACASAASANRVDLLMFENAGGVDPLIVDLWVDVIDQGSTVDFVFHNDSTDGVVAAIYFESNGVSTGLMANGALGATSGIVNFDTPASPGSPPGSISGFGGTWGGNLFAADADSPAPTNGIGVGETLTISFDLLGSYGDVLGALQNPDTGFRIAQHATSFGQNSIWTTTVPAPGAAALLGLGGLIAGRRRR